MTHVITSDCQSSCTLECVSVCPVDAIHGPPEGTVARQMFIDPGSCIDCTLCASVCPVSAPVIDVDLPAAHQGDLERNAAFFG